MDFVLDTLRDGRSFRAFTIVDDFTREAPVIEVDLSLSSERIVRVPEQLRHQRGLPKVIICHTGPEFQRRALNGWACQHAWCNPAIHSAGEARGERAHRELQR